MKPTKVATPAKDVRRDAYRDVAAVTESSINVLIENVPALDRLNAQLLMADLIIQDLMKVDAHNMSLLMAEIVAMRRAQVAGEQINTKASQRRQMDFFAAAIAAARLRAIQPEGTT